MFNKYRGLICCVLATVVIILIIQKLVCKCSCQNMLVGSSTRARLASKLGKKAARKKSKKNLRRGSTWQPADLGPPPRKAQIGLDVDWGKVGIRSHFGAGPSIKKIGERTAPSVVKYSINNSDKKLSDNSLQGQGYDQKSVLGAGLGAAKFLWGDRTETSIVNPYYDTFHQAGSLIKKKKSPFTQDTFDTFVADSGKLAISENPLAWGEIIQDISRNKTLQKLGVETLNHNPIYGDGKQQMKVFNTLNPSYGNTHLIKKTNRAIEGLADHGVKFLTSGRKDANTKENNSSWAENEDDGNQSYKLGVNEEFKFLPF